MRLGNRSPSNLYGTSHTDGQSANPVDDAVRTGARSQVERVIKTTAKLKAAAEAETCAEAQSHAAEESHQGVPPPSRSRSRTRTPSGHHWARPLASSP
ncbi:hypothetical protein ACWERY_06125 [Streptomyces sp. NPDC004082]